MKYQDAMSASLMFLVTYVEKKQLRWPDVYFACEQLSIGLMGVKT